jgi:exosortase
MPNPSSEPSTGDRPCSESGVSKGLRWGSVALTALVLFWFYALETRYGSLRDESAFRWLASAWNGETDYEHGLMFPFLIGGLIIYRWKDLKASVGEGCHWGLAVIVFGALLYIAGYRTLQPRVTVGALPFIVWGSVVYLWGWQVSKILLFPIFFFWLAIPLPGFQQATTHLQLIATSMAHHGSGLFGVETYVEGTKVLPIKGNWKPLDIAAGCSGIRSLMALLMISAAWAYVAKMALWKKGVLFLAAFPLAILGNALRVISIFVIAEYGDAEWASTTWHDWSGLLLFFPISLALLLGIHTLLEGGLPWKKAKQRQVRRVVTRSTNPSESIVPEL